MIDVKNLANTEGLIIKYGLVNDLMSLADLDPRIGFESLAVQSDNTIIVCDVCGNFGYVTEVNINVMLNRHERGIK